MKLSSKLEKFLKEKQNLATPFIVFDTDILKNKYKEFKDNLPIYDVFYAVKCNPAKEILINLHALGSFFDVASIEEIDLCLSLGIPASKLSWGEYNKKG